jgi:hypothetical protein
MVKVFCFIKTVIEVNLYGRITNKLEKGSLPLRTDNFKNLSMEIMKKIKNKNPI